MIRTCCIVCLTAVAVLTAGQAHAIWAPVPLEILVDEAHLIVEGTVTEVKAPGFDVPDMRPQELAVIKVESVLKAPPKAAKPKEIGILQPAGGGIAVSTDLKFMVGQKGTWLVKKDPALDAYRINHPSQIQPATEKKKLAELVKAREKLKGGKPVAGLVARAELLEHKAAAGGDGAKSYEIRFSLKNVSDKPIAVFDFVGARPLVVDWTGPDGEKQESLHYEWLKAARLRAPDKTNFTTILAGGVHFIGPGGKESGIHFGGEVRDSNPLTPGKHKIVVSYRSEEDGKRFGLKDGWTGTVAANEVDLSHAGAAKPR